MNQRIQILLSLLASTLCLPVLGAPTVVTYQGRVTSNGTNFTGVGQFKAVLATGTNTSSQATATATTSGGFVTIIVVPFGGSGYVTAPAVTISGGGGSGATATASISGGVVTGIAVNNAGSGYTSTPSVTLSAPPENISYTTVWSNDGTSTAGSEPALAVGASVAAGLFTLPLGDTTLSNMSSLLDSAVFSQSGLKLRIWFNDGTSGFAVLSPAQSLTFAPYAAYATGASNLLGALPVEKLTGTVPLAQLPGAVITNGQSGVTLNGAFGGDGAGLSSLSASQLASGTVPDARLSANVPRLSGGKLTDSVLSANVPLLDSNETFTGAVQFNNAIGSFTGNGAGLTNLSGIAAGVVTEQMLAPSLAQRLGVSLFGYGFDGDVTISSPTTLTRDMYYSNLTVNAGIVLNTGGFRIFVRDTCTISAGGAIRNDGTAASTFTGGAGAPSQTLAGGGYGVNGTGSTGLTATNVTDSAGGSGGNGGFFSSSAHGLGGTATVVAAANGGANILRTLPNAILGRHLGGVVVKGGAGGGSGGGANGGGSQSGGGGGGGGVVMLAAHFITGAGTVQARGGAGGTTTTGGGGGGGGGGIIIVSDQAPAGVTVDVSGGAAGSGGSSPSPTAGGPGTAILLY